MDITEKAILKELIRRDNIMYTQIKRTSEQEAHAVFKQWLRDSIPSSRCYK